MTKLREILSWDEQDPGNVGWYYALEDDTGKVIEQSMDVTWCERSGIDIDAYGPDDEAALREALAAYRTATQGDDDEFEEELATAISYSGPFDGGGATESERAGKGYCVPIT